MPSRELDAQIAGLTDQIIPLQERRDKLSRERDELLSREFIAVNNIRRADVELLEDCPYFGTIDNCIAWLRDNSLKRWAEWNGRIYYVSDLLAGRMPETPGRIEHVPN